MLHQKSLYLLVAQISVVYCDSEPQTFFGGEHQPAGHFQKPYQQPAATYQKPVASYQQPTPTYQQPTPTYQQSPATYQQPATTYQQPAATYQQPATTYQQPATTYQQPATTYQQPATTYQQQPYLQPQQANYPTPRGSSIGSNGCTVDYIDEYADICLPTFQTDCAKEEVNDGKTLGEEEECYSVTKTICMESENVEDNEVCAYSYNLVPESAPATTVTAKWVKSCSEESICLNPHQSPGGYAAPHYCHQQTKQICNLNPVLVPVTKNVTIKLPKPVATCINQPIHLPKLDCEQVSEERCTMAPVVTSGQTVTVDKCVISVGEASCQKTVLQLPRQGCVDKVINIRNIYEVVDAARAAYSG